MFFGVSEGFQWFILRKIIVFQGFRGVSSLTKGVELFRGGAEGMMVVVGVKLLISIETYRTFDFPGGGGSGPYSTSGSPPMHSFLEFKFIFLAPFNYVETHCTWWIILKHL